MKRIVVSLLSVFCLFSLVACRAKTSEKLLLGGSGWDKIAIIDKDTKQIEWEHPLEQGWECNSVAAMPDGNILFSYKKGAMMISRDHKVIWDIKSPGESHETQTARLLPNGNILLASCGHPAVIKEVSPDGKVLSEMQYETGIEDPHAQFRQINKNERGNYLIPLFATSDIREVSPEGKLLKSFNVGGVLFAVVDLPNGNQLVSCGDGHAYKEINFDEGKIIREVKENDIEGARLFFVAQLLSTKDGTYICNWQGHDKEVTAGEYPQLIEVDDSGKIIWSLNDNAKFGMISTVCAVIK